MSLLFLAGFGFATFLIYGGEQLYELIRHRSLLEYQTPEISKEWCIFAVGGFVVWIVSLFLAGGFP